ncbi:hypothetical protein D1614_08830 [Maribellus luteus]|uniref:DUF1761 domain-containing protein n=1 Tax=Maribellus luteus TaxID=2305463 RepID=A0A399SX06_9BACT|nr:hypothetical protein [Maribellus luteus]RIJ48630.1 hypothetical protein D1614_08830 [Maribellus luteus]
MKILKGTIFGAIAFFFLGWLVWGILLMDFSMNNYNTEIYLPEDEIIWWAMIVSNLALALMYTLILKWAGAKTLVDGVKIAATIGALYALSIDLGYYSMTNVILNLSAIVVDTLAYLAISAITGLIIVATWGKDKAA